MTCGTFFNQIHTIAQACPAARLRYFDRTTWKTAPLVFDANNEYEIACQAALESVLRGWRDSDMNFRCQWNVFRTKILAGACLEDALGIESCKLIGSEVVISGFAKVERDV